MDSLQQARKLLEDTGAACIALRQRDGRQIVYQSEARGIAPILKPMQEDPDFFKDAVVADKVIGKSAALLLVKSGIKTLYAKVISEYAVQVLDSNGIIYEYQEKVPYIVNRAGDGMCPMEESVLNTQDTEEAYLLLQEKIRQMQG